MNLILSWILDLEFRIKQFKKIKSGWNVQVYFFKSEKKDSKNFISGKMA